MKVFIPLSAYLFLFSCSSALKQQCEKTNWFEHGKGVALSGKRLNSDTFVAQCKNEKVDVNEAQVDLGFKAGMSQYCTPEGARNVGRRGDVLNPDMCNAAGFGSLRREYEEGLVFYCKPENAYQEGALGKTYQNVCPANVETAFLSQYRKGRSVYLSNIIDSKTDEIRSLERQHQLTVSQELQLKNQLSRLIASQRRASSSNLTPERIEQDQKDRQPLEGQIRQESRKRAEIEKKISDLRSEISQLRVERGAVDI